VKKALVAGALGVSGRALVNHLSPCRTGKSSGYPAGRPSSSPRHATSPSISSTNPTLTPASSGLGDLTHIFYAALQPGSNFFDEIPPNLAMLRHIVEAVERTSFLVP